jgi:hypothetical protein
VATRPLDAPEKTTMSFERKDYKAGTFIVGAAYPVVGKDWPAPAAPRFGDQLKLPSLAEISRRLKHAREQLEVIQRQVKRR